MFRDLKKAATDDITIEPFCLESPLSASAAFFLDLSVKGVPQVKLVEYAQVRSV